MGRKKEEPKTEDAGVFPCFAVTSDDETDEQRENRQLDEAYKKAEERGDRRAKAAQNSFDRPTKQHIQSLLQSVVDGKARFRSRNRKMTAADGHAIVRTALFALNEGLPNEAKAKVQLAADTLIRDDNDNFAELGEFARMASIDIASQFTIGAEADDDRPVADVVASIPRA